MLLLPPELLPTAFSRDEIVALFNTLASFSAAIEHVKEMSNAIYKSYYTNPPPPTITTADAGSAMVGKTPPSQQPPRPVGLVYSEECDSHTLRDGFGKERTHTERPERTQAVWDRLCKSGLAEQCERVAARESTRLEAERCHTCEHIDALDALEHVPPRNVGGWFGQLAAANRPLGVASAGCAPLPPKHAQRKPDGMCVRAGGRALALTCTTHHQRHAPRASLPVASSSFPTESALVSCAPDLL